MRAEKVNSRAPSRSLRPADGGPPALRSRLASSACQLTARPWERFYTSRVFLLLQLACGPLTIDLRADEPPPDSEAQACLDPSPIEVTMPLERSWSTCPWGEEDNLEQGQQIVTARVEEAQGLALDATICSLELGEVVPYYDDGFFLLLGDAVLATSHAELIDALEVEDGLPRYDWERLAGQPFTEESGWCLGEDQGSDCEVPGARSGDSLQLDLAEGALERLDGPLQLSWVTFGDNDDWTDCTHAEMELVLELQVGG